MHHEVFNGFRPGEVVDNRYEILDQIGQGGFGIVYRARQMAIGRVVALKVLLPEADTVDPMAVERFRREAVLISSLESPNTITLIEFGQTHHGVLYTVMEFAKGITLRDMLAREGKLTPERAVHIARQVLTSLHEAHLRGIVHRDLKPANIMIGEFAGQKDHVKVLDFGIAKILKSGADTQSTLALTGRIVGTPKYMSPEQIRGVTPTPAADLYAMGLIMYEMLSGEPAIKSNEPMEQVEAQLRKEDITLPANLPGVPSALIAAINRALKKNPAERFSAADTFIQALEGSISKQVVGGLAAAVTVQRQAVVPGGGSMAVPGKRIIGGPSPGPPTATMEEEEGSSLGAYLIVAVILFLVAAAGTVFMMVKNKPGGGGTPAGVSDAAVVQQEPGQLEMGISQVSQPDAGTAVDPFSDAGQAPTEQVDAGPTQEVPDAEVAQVVPEPVAPREPRPPVEPPRETRDAGPAVPIAEVPPPVTPPVIPPEIPALPPEVPQPEQVAVAQTVAVEIVADPSRARVTVGEERVCSSTPCTIQVPADGTPVSVRVSKSDYETARLDVSSSDAPRVEVRLRRREEEPEIAPIE